MAIIYTLYNSIIRKHRDAISFIVLFFFLITFVVSRTYIYLNTIGVVPDEWILNKNVRGVHIHHLAFGIIFLTVAGFLALTIHGQRSRHYISALYGIGLGLAYDEFGMWLRLKDEYWLRQSYDAVAIISAVLINIVYFGNLWQKIFFKIVALATRIKHRRSQKLQSAPLPRRLQE
ncbi:hypothetical protein HY946_00165 [Candidatus Gottesmanbacteria bacterium]|nr:hypothetical protein [Candidatus Gottesmanbacteria bacterium]